MSRLHRSQRDVRKRMLLLEAELHRVDIAASIGHLRKPVSHLRYLPVLLGLFGGTSRLARGMAGAFAGDRRKWIVRAIPLVLAGWRIAKLLRNLLARRGAAVKVPAA